MYELRAEHYYYLATLLLCTMHCSVLVLQYLCGSPVWFHTWRVFVHFCSDIQ